MQNRSSIHHSLVSAIGLAWFSVSFPQACMVGTVEMDQNYDMPQEGLLAYWNLDEPAGTIAQDHTENMNHGTVDKATLFRPNQGQYGGAIELNGSDSITIQHASAFEQNKAISVAAWVFNKAQGCTEQAIISKGQQAWALVHDCTNDEIRFTCCGHAGVVSQGGLGLNQWHHVAGVYNGRRLLLFRDGKLESSAPTTGPLVVGQKDIHIGSDPDSNSQGFRGLIDDVVIYARALSPDEIQATRLAGVSALPDRQAPAMNVQLATLKGKLASTDVWNTFRVNGKEVQIQADGSWEVQIPLEDIRAEIQLEVVDRQGNVMNLPSLKVTVTQNNVSQP